MARGIIKAHPSPAEFRERLAIQSRYAPSARELFEVRVEAVRAIRAAEATSSEGVRS